MAQATGAVRRFCGLVDGKIMRGEPGASAHGSGWPGGPGAEPMALATGAVRRFCGLVDGKIMRGEPGASAHGLGWLKG